LQACRRLPFNSSKLAAWGMGAKKLRWA